VHSSVMFGHGRFNVGIIIEPAPGHNFDPVDQVQVSSFRNSIWFIASLPLRIALLTPSTCPRSTVQRMNDLAPQQSRLFKEVSLQLI
jgi:hypothetical protein